MNDGRLQQCDAPRVLYERPVNTFVAGFIGSPAMNLVTVPVVERHASRSAASRSPAARERLRHARRRRRPESLELAPDGIAARVEVVEEIGADACVFCAAEIGGEETKLVARAARRSRRSGERACHLRPVAADAHVFDPVGGSRLG